MRLLRRRDFEVESFEYLPVGPDLALLRLAGRWRSDATLPASVMLVATSRREREQLAPLPDPPGQEGEGAVWRGAFSAPRGLVERRIAFTLETPDGRVVALPAPLHHTGGEPAAPPPSESRPRRTRGRRGRGAAARDRNGPGDELAAERSARAEAERALDEERARADRAEESLREQLTLTLNEAAEFMSRLEGYEERRAELERELSWERLVHKETRRASDEADRARTEADAERERAQAELDRVRELGRQELDAERAARAEVVQELDSVRAELATLAAQAIEHQGEVERLSRARTQAEADAGGAVERLQRELDGLRESGERELTVATERGSSLEAELDAERERAAGLEAVVAERDGLLQNARVGIEHGTAELADLERQVERLRESVRARARADRAEAARRSDSMRRGTRHPDPLVHMRIEADRGAVRVAALERRVTELRDAIGARVASEAGLGQARQNLAVDGASAGDGKAPVAMRAGRRGRRLRFRRAR